MKVTGLLFIALNVVALAEASHKDYVLKCSHSEMGIRWPSYKSHAEYYVCHRLGDRPMIVPCNSGEVFTFVLQMCTSPSRFIPAPALEILPTDSPLTAHLNNKHEAIKPLLINNVAQPPIYSELNHHEHQQVVPQIPPVMTFDVPTLSVVAHNTESEEHTNHLEAPQESVKPHKPVAKPPMPPTPAPTPPVVEIEETPSKSQDKRPKKPSAPAKPSKADDKKPSTSTKEEKKSPKKPTNTKSKLKDSKNTPKKTPAPVKKSPKAPTKA